MRYLIIYLSLIISACSSRSVPDDVIQPVAMQKVVSELLLVDEYINNYLVKDSTINIKEKRSVLYEQTFKLNNVSRKEFYSSLQYYQQNPDRQKALFDSIINSLDKKKPVPGKEKTQ